MTKPLTIALTGDVMLGRGVNAALHRYGFKWVWGNVIEDLKKADLTIINLECVIAAGGRRWSRWEKVFHFRAEPLAMRALQSAGVNAVCLANNHVLDFETEAFLEMLELLENVGIAYAGAGRNLTVARRAAILETKDLRVGLIAFTDNEPGWAATETSSGTNWIEVSAEEKSLEPVRECINDARLHGAELVIFSIHWGPNMVERPSAIFQQFARAVIETGADVFHGHSAHIVQGVEIYRGKPIIYDAGDFVDDYSVDARLRNDLSFLFRLKLEEKKVKQIELLPVQIGNRQVNFATGAAREIITARIRILSAEMGTTVREKDGRLWLECSG